MLVLTLAVEVKNALPCLESNNSGPAELIEVKTEFSGGV